MKDKQHRNTHSARGHKSEDLTPAKRRLFSIIVLILPVVIFFLLEVGLRLFHYGPDISLFRSEVINGQSYYVFNPEVKSRYFLRYPYNPSQPPDYFPAKKMPGAYRIFCLGGSTTVGYPYWYNGAFSTFLRDRLQQVFPARHIDVINVGMTATNSFTVVDMGRDLVDYEPDLFIVYDGHNEFYGALGIASHESLGEFRWLTNFYLRAIHLRTFLLVRDAYGKIADLFRTPESSNPATATLMETLAKGQYVSYRSKTYEKCLEIFKDNLRDLKSLAVARKIPMILSSQVSNLRGQAPFVSQDESPSATDRTLAFHRLFDAGLRQLQGGNIDSATNDFNQAVRLDSLRADAHYELARCFDYQQRKTDARREYIKARDYDELRFRASTDFNNAIRSISDGSEVTFVDMEEAFQAHSPDSLIGNELITEHLHPNSHGYFIMAKEFARAMREHQLLASAGDWQMADTISDDVLWQKRSLTVLDELIARRRTEILTAGWPFTSGVPVVNSVDEKDTLGHIVEQVTRARWDWTRAHESAAQYYLLRNEREKAEGEYRVIISQLRFLDVQPYLKLARILLDEKKYNDVRTVLLSSLDVQPTILAYRALGDMSLNSGRPTEAIAYYEKMSIFPQSSSEQLENGYMLALAYSHAGMTHQARSQLLKILSIKPDFQPAVELLQKIKPDSQ
ncbi:MAG: tetratricopeptide repeat protein [Bacteroidota bacterium]|jgi:tetratricopeptide (TPR) repeat protein